MGLLTSIVQKGTKKLGHLAVEGGHLLGWVPGPFGGLGGAVAAAGRASEGDAPADVTKELVRGGAALAGGKVLSKIPGIDKTVSKIPGLGNALHKIPGLDRIEGIAGEMKAPGMKLPTVDIPGLGKIDLSSLPGLSSQLGKLTGGKVSGADIAKALGFAIPGGLGLAQSIKAGNAQDKLLGQESDLASTAAQNAQQLFAGAQPIRQAAETQLLARLTAGPRAIPDLSTVVDRRNPFRKNYGTVPPPAAPPTPAPAPAAPSLASQLAKAAQHLGIPRGVPTAAPAPTPAPAPAAPAPAAGGFGGLIAQLQRTPPKKRVVPAA